MARTSAVCGIVPDGRDRERARLRPALLEGTATEFPKPNGPAGAAARAPAARAARGNRARVEVTLHRRDAVRAGVDHVHARQRDRASGGRQPHAAPCWCRVSPARRRRGSAPASKTHDVELRSRTRSRGARHAPIASPAIAGVTGVGVRAARQRRSRRPREASRTRSRASGSGDAASSADMKDTPVCVRGSRGDWLRGRAGGILSRAGIRPSAHVALGAEVGALTSGAVSTRQHL